MKKHFNFKTLISVVLACVLFLPGASAYYSSMALVGNSSRSTLRYPMYQGSYIDISSSKRKVYCSRYASFLDKHPSQYSEVCESGIRKLQNVYEEEVRHIGAASYATALYLGCDDSEALKFSTGTVSLCNLIIGYPRSFNRNLLVFVANYIYALLGGVFKEGVKSDLNAVELHRKFSEAAYMSSSTYCQIDGEPLGSVISADMIASCMASPE